jgi:fibro-slime domain-containing protein
VIEDQFGTRQGTPQAASILCAPLMPTVGPTSTSTTTSLPATTTTAAATTSTTTTVPATTTTTVATTSTTTTAPSTTTTTSTTTTSTTTATTTTVPTCGNGILQSGEECDDGNRIPFDGCSSTCTIEPACAGGTCTATCGDGIVEPGEQCDDGNLIAGDGCSATCTIEPGFTCTAAIQTPPTTLTMPILYRDMLYAGTTVPGPGHPDFESFGSGVATGLVQSTLGADSKPVFGPNGSAALTNAVDFCWWYHDTGCAGAGSTNPFDKLVYLDGSASPTTLTLNSTSTNSYTFGAPQFYPIDALGWNAGANPQLGTDCGGSTGHNFSFTSEWHYPFTYRAGTSQTFTFNGDDDAWAFINGHLAIDSGGVHGAITGTVTLDSSTATMLGLVDGGIYTLDFFKAERHTCSSVYTVTLSGFVANTTSQCAPE